MLYEQDFYAWTIATAKALRERDLINLDWDNLIEEIESLGRQEKRELINRLIILVMHLLKWQYQPNKRSRSWELTIKIQRLDVEKLLLDNPSLKSYLKEAISSGYNKAVLKAAQETGLAIEVFPSVCPYTWEELIDNDFMPN
ncbi:protein of unknown function DUF29 [Stanieria cyanosphaera PCC 7437]|uniref:DUF29 domain-containing protein n=1 Tax=Stanieria cyanosphaera (strain ATCC 29371 / PCC 7437) TaxID=111780 RepID=K9XVH1_STAC7|nr:DUF29 domain-containing protein [Stanieria cyanosphaera]AFZ36054.1 protein of unknown function DUF29 [Stanieria cyanosphaera PCC 7437]